LLWSDREICNCYAVAKPAAAATINWPQGTGRALQAKLSGIVKVAAEATDSGWDFLAVSDRHSESRTLLCEENRL